MFVFTGARETVYNIFRATIPTRLSRNLVHLPKKMVLNPAQSGEFIVKNAKFVTVKPEGIAALTKEVHEFIHNIA